MTIAITVNETSEPRMYMRGFIAFISIALLVAARARADVSPLLQGAYRTGRYMPVRVTSASGSVSADGAFATSWIGGAGVVPVLVYGSPRELVSSDGQRVPLHPIGEGERLVAFTPEVQKNAAGLFGSNARVDVTLDAADPLPGPAAAWETLDAVVLNADQMRRIDDDQRSALLRAGVMFAVLGDAAPDTDWPWQREGLLWVLRYTPIGPRDELVNAEAFGPTLGWNAGWPAVVRGQVVAVGALVGIVVLSLALWRSRFAVSAMSIVIIAATFGVVLWRRQLGTTVAGGGDVVVVSEQRWVQRDSWLYERARLDSLNIIRWAGSTRPVFASTDALAAADLHLHANTATGEASFEYAAKRGQTIAFMRRTVGPGPAPAIGAATKSSPMWEVAKDAYAAHGQSMQGEAAPTQPGRWPAVVIEQAAK